MCIAVGMTTNHIAVADSATQNSNIVASLKYMSELNKLRQTRRTALSTQQIITAPTCNPGKLRKTLLTAPLLMSLM